MLVMSSEECCFSLDKGDVFRSHRLRCGGAETSTVAEVRETITEDEDSLPFRLFPQLVHHITYWTEKSETAGECSRIVYSLIFCYFTPSTSNVLDPRGDQLPNKILPQFNHLTGSQNHQGTNIIR